jgi:hypothetical protein
MTHLKTFTDSNISSRSIVIRSSAMSLARWTLLHATKSLLLFLGVFRQCRTHFRLKGGVGAGSRRNTFGGAATFTFPSLLRSHRSFPTTWH